MTNVSIGFYDNFKTVQIDAKAPALKDEKKKRQSLAQEYEEGATGPLEIKISVKLFHWTSVTDPINDEKKKNDLLRKKEQSELA